MDYARRSHALQGYSYVTHNLIIPALIGPSLYYLEPHLNFAIRLFIVLSSLRYFSASALSTFTSRLKAAIPPAIIFFLARDSRGTLLALGFKWLETREFPAILLYISGDTSDEEAIDAIILNVIPLACYCISIACAACIPLILQAFWICVTQPGLLAFLILCFQYRDTLYSHVSDSFITRSLKLPVFQRLWVLTLQCFILLYRHITKFHDYLTAKLERDIEWRQRYTYEPLAAGDIRLLKVLRRRLLSELRCELIHVPLSSAPDYEAISYCWGRDPPSKTIVVNGQRLVVLASVYDVLHYRHSFWTDRLLWIDSICINQEKHDEKEAQIPLMRQIFSQATRVLAWLGDMEDAWSARLAVLKLIPGRVGLSLESILQQDSPVTKGSTRGLHFLAELFCKPWFNRIWVVQEVALAKSVHIVFGRICMNWNTLVPAIRIIFHPTIVGSFYTLKAPSFIIPFSSLSNALKTASFRDKIQDGKPDSLTSIMAQSSSFEASLDHDRIYALLGLTDKSGSRILPSYSKPVQEVYTDVMRLLLQMDDPLSVLAMAGIGMKRNPKLKDLPSWVLDWSTPTPVTHLDSPWLPKRSDGDLHYGDEAGARYTVRISVPLGNRRLVQVGGNIADEIIAVGRRDTGLSHLKGVSAATEVSYLEVVREWVLDAEKLAWTYSEDPYPSRCTDRCGLQWECLGNAFQRTLTRGRTLGIGDPSRSIRDDFSAFKWVLGLSDDSPSPPPYKQLLLMESEMNMAMGDAEERFLAARAFISISSVWETSRIAVTKKKYLAIVPPETQIGDVVAIVLGAKTPYILRRKEAKLAGGITWELVGTTYVHGCMDEDGLPENVEMLNLV